MVVDSLQIKNKIAPHINKYNAVLTLCSIVVAAEEDVLAYVYGILTLIHINM